MIADSSRFVPCLSILHENLYGVKPNSKKFACAAFIHERGYLFGGAASKLNNDLKSFSMV
jgi:hypothetical protein